MCGWKDLSESASVYTGTFAAGWVRLSKFKAVLGKCEDAILDSTYDESPMAVLWHSTEGREARRVSKPCAFSSSAILPFVDSIKLDGSELTSRKIQGKFPCKMTSHVVCYSQFPMTLLSHHMLSKSPIDRKNSMLRKGIITLLASPSSTYIGHIYIHVPF